MSIPAIRWGVIRRVAITIWTLVAGAAGGMDHVVLVEDRVTGIEHDVLPGLREDLGRTGGPGRRSPDHGGGAGDERPDRCRTQAAKRG
jgi:hypothetical protein